MEHGLPDSQGVSGQFFKACIKQVAQCLHHPFITALAQGSLSRYSWPLGPFDPGSTQWPIRG